MAHHHSAAQLTPIAQHRLGRLSPFHSLPPSDLGLRRDAFSSRNGGLLASSTPSQKAGYAASSPNQSDVPNYTYGPSDDACESDVDCNSLPHALVPSASADLSRVSQTVTAVRSYAKPANVETPADDTPHDQTHTHLDNNCSAHRARCDKSEALCATGVSTSDPVALLKIAETFDPERSTITSAPSPSISIASDSHSPAVTKSSRISLRSVGNLVLALIRQWQIAQHISLSLRSENVKAELERVDSLFDLPDVLTIAYSELSEDDFNDNSDSHSELEEHLVLKSEDLQRQGRNRSEGHCHHAEHDAPSDAPDGQGVHTNQGHMGHSFNSGFSAAGYAGQSQGSSYNNLCIPGGDRGGGSGRGQPSRKRARPEEQEYVRCVFYGTPHQRDGCEIQQQYVSHLRRHHEHKHAFFYCHTCGPLSNKEERQWHQECFELCQSESCPRYSEYLRDRDDASNSCRHQNSQRDKWRTVYRIGQQAFGFQHPNGHIPEPEPLLRDLSAPGAGPNQVAQGDVQVPTTPGASNNRRSRPLDNVPMPTPQVTPRREYSLHDFVALARRSAAAVQAVAEQSMAFDHELRPLLRIAVASLVEVEQQVAQITAEQALHASTAPNMHANHRTPDTSTSSGQQPYRFGQSNNASSSPFAEVNEAGATGVLPQSSPTTNTTTHAGALFEEHNAQYPHLHIPLAPVGVTRSYRPLQGSGDGT